MRQTVVGVFDRYEEARRAAALLQDSGFGPDSVHVTESTFGEEEQATSSQHGSGGLMENIRSFFAEVFGSGDRDEVSAYAEAVRRGGAVVKVDVDEDDQVDIARDTLQTAGAVDIEERVAEWRQAGWSGEPAGMASEGDSLIRSGRDSGEALAGGQTAGVWSPSGSSGMAAGGQSGALSQRDAGADRGTEEVIPVVKEELEVGKRTVGTGGVRVYARAVEQPVQESVELREEHAHVERHPVDRPASDSDLDAFRDRTVEVRETAEKAVAQKTARVVEEVVVGKEATQRTETISDTLRNTEVEVERLAPQADPSSAGSRDGRSDFERYSDDFESDYRTRYAALGGSYDEYLPAYRYGHSMAGDARYGGRPWNEVEPVLQSDWEQRYPGSPWERFKDAVRHAWQRVSG